MSQYLIALGHNEALVDLDPLVPQPASAGIFYARRSYAASGTLYDELPYVELVYSAFLSVTEYQTLLAQCGLTSADSALVTVYVQNEYYNWVRLNGTIIKPEPGRDGARSNYWLRNFVLLVKNLTAVS